VSHRALGALLLVVGIVAATAAEELTATPRP
jgi:hypothetical protein